MIHPECQEAVDAECKRLISNNPSVSPLVCSAVAIRFVRAVAVADTIEFMRSMEVDNEAH